MSLNDHPPEEAFELYSIGTLAEERLEAFEGHLLICPACQDRLQEADAYVAAMQHAAAKLQSEAPARSWNPFHWLRSPAWTLAPAAAGVLLVFFLASDVLNRQTVHPVTVTLEAARGGVLPGARGPAGQPLTLVMPTGDLPALDTYAVEVVDGRGQAVVARQGRSEDNRLSITLPKLSHGLYWVRLYDSTRHELLREFGLQVL